MANSIKSISLEKLKGHPGNPNRMSDSNYRKLVRNIELGEHYEPLVVRPHPKERGHYQIINGHHRCSALKELGYEKADCVVWDIDDEQTDILLATLNRLGGTDELDKKLKLLRRLNTRYEARELSRLLPQTKLQIEKLLNFKAVQPPAVTSLKPFAQPMVFFLSEAQQEVVEKALSLALEKVGEKNKAARRAAALAKIASGYLESGDKQKAGV
ncbi:MAG TPA: ParB N-terminal domain-containing protein [Planctomycetes bacterium]|nr:ParB N-terminal domain-containing protein [Planctomycetota bacterium]